MFEGIKAWWNDFLKRLVEANKKEFGNKPPSCCDTKDKIAVQVKSSERRDKLN
jgi:hypothetical protein